MKQLKKYFLLSIFLTLSILVVACGESSASETEQSLYSENQLILDYSSEGLFEQALNAGEKTEGKIVRFVVREVQPDSALGFNLWAGEHLNFVSKDSFEASKGDELIVRITKVKKVLGSWKLNYEIIDTTGLELIVHPSEDEDIQAVAERMIPDFDGASLLPFASWECEGKNYQTVEKSFKDAGFNNIVVVPVETNFRESERKEGEVIRVVCGNNDSFNKNDEVDKSVEIQIEYAIFTVESSASEIIKVDETDSKTSISEEETIISDTSKEEQTNKEDETKKNTTTDTETSTSAEDEKETKTVETPEYSVKDVNEIMYATTDVNVRKGPGLDYDKLGSISLNQEVKVTGMVDNGWYRIKYNSGDGFVRDGYLSKEKKVIVTPVPTDPPSSGGNGDDGNLVVVPTVPDVSGDLVWVPTNGGKKYHNNSYCSKMIDPIQVTREHAEQNGFTPCGKCY